LPLLLPVLAYWGANVLSTVTSSADLARGLSLDLLTLDLVILYLVLAGYLTTRPRLLRAVHVWLGVAAVEAVVGVLCFALYLVTHSAVFGVQLAPDTAAPMVYGTLYEANIFGSYMGASFLIALALAADDTARHKTLLYGVCVATAVGLLLSATRSAWGGTALGAILLLALLRTGQGGRRSRLSGRLVGGLLAVGVVVGVGLAVAPSSVTGRLGARVQELVNFGSGSGYGRLLLYKEALAEWQTHPWLGLGPGSFNYRLPGDTTPGPAWLPNLTLQALHDTGIVGLLTMLWLFVAFYVITIRALRRAPPGSARTVLAGLIAAVTTLLISFQLTPGFSLGYSWALLALAVAAARVVGVVEQAGAREPVAA
jgi:O-antigen ligase